MSADQLRFTQLNCKDLSPNPLTKMVHPRCRCSGRLEILHTTPFDQKQVWGTVCKSGTFGTVEASVVCKQLIKDGYGCGPKGKPVSLDQFGELANAKLWLSRVDCQGGEECLEQCSHKPWGYAF